MRSNAVPWPPGSNVLMPTGSPTSIRAIMPSSMSASPKGIPAASPFHARLDHAPEKQSACCSVYTVGTSPFNVACRYWIAWPNSWAITTATIDGPNSSASLKITPSSPSS